MTEGADFPLSDVVVDLVALLSLGLDAINVPALVDAEILVIGILEAEVGPGSEVGIALDLGEVTGFVVPGAGVAGVKGLELSPPTESMDVPVFGIGEEGVVTKVACLVVSFADSLGVDETARIEVIEVGPPVGRVEVARVGELTSVAFLTGS